MKSALTIVGLVADLHWLITIVVVLAWSRNGRKSLGAWIDDEIATAHKTLTLICIPRDSHK